MNSLRKKHEPEKCAQAPNGCVIDYSDEVTAEQVAKIDSLVKKEFERGNWVTLEAES